MKCDCCEFFGQEQTGDVQFCKLCNKWFCDGCRYSKRRMEYFLKYQTKTLVYNSLPAHLQKYADKFLLR
jgi:hypothetical protein